jgi:hypothetical protein
VIGFSRRWKRSTEWNIFWTIADGSREPPLELTAADAEPLTELLNSTIRMTGKPADGGAYRLVNQNRVGQDAKRGRLKRRPEVIAAFLLV